MHELRTDVPASEAGPALLLCTVGGSYQPIVKTIHGFQPQRVLFLASATSRMMVERDILPGLQSMGCELSAGQYEIHAVPDAEDIAGCIAVFREQETAVQEWLARGSRYRVLVDITGGTKCMAAALTLVAHRWTCTFIYVGGRQRSNQGLETVVSGSEQVVIRVNPWESLGYQGIEDAIRLFDEGNYAAAETLLKRCMKNVEEACTRRELSTLSQLVQLYDAWDRFHHKTAGHHLQEVQKNFNDLQQVLPWARHDLKHLLRQHRDVLDRLQQAGPGLEWVHDLMANAWRKAQEHRYADAVARLYRAIEALAQTRLRQQYDRDTSRLALESLPAPLREEWAPSCPA